MYISCIMGFHTLNFVQKEGKDAQKIPFLASNLPYFSEAQVQRKGLTMTFIFHIDRMHIPKQLSCIKYSIYYIL